MKAALVQINNSFAGQNYLPYSAAILQSYFYGNSSASAEYQFLPTLYKRLSVQAAVNHIAEASIIGFSLYVWNTRLSLAIAKAYKEINPEGFVFVGGPSTPDSSEQFLRENPFIDIALHNEGEISTSKLLEEFVGEKNLFNVPSASFIAGQKFYKTEVANRIANLTDIPSPFLMGFFDSLLEFNQSEKWIGLWETNRGCPFTCTYCDWGSAVGSKKIGMFPTDRLTEEMMWFSSNKIEYIFCCDANFGMFPRDPDIAKMTGEIKQKSGFPQALSVQNTKNSTERSYLTQKILCDYGLNKGVTLSMQTLSNEALVNIKRSNIKLASYFELQKRFIDQKVPTYSDLILALPGETHDSFIKGLCDLIESGQHSRIQFNNLSILPNAEMARSDYREKHGLITVISDIVNMHGSLCSEDADIVEKQEMVIGAHSLPVQDWISVRKYSWLVAFLYFNKLAQIPIAILNGTLGIDLKDIFCAIQSAGDEFPTLKFILELLDSEAESMTEGGSEFKHSKEWLNIYWPVDEYLFIHLVANSQLKSFYEELSIILESLILTSYGDLAVYYGHSSIASIIKESCDLNYRLLNVPGQDLSKKITLTWNIMDCYTSRISGTFDKLESTSITYSVTQSRSFSSFDEWLQNVVWYGNKRGDYLNGLVATSETVEL